MACGRCLGDYNYLLKIRVKWTSRPTHRIYRRGLVDKLDFDVDVFRSQSNQDFKQTLHRSIQCIPLIRWSLRIEKFNKLKMTMSNVSPLPSGMHNTTLTSIQFNWNNIETDWKNVTYFYLIPDLTINKSTWTVVNTHRHTRTHRDTGASTLRRPSKPPTVEPFNNDV